MPSTDEAVSSFKRALGIISHSRAGWDYDLSPAERAKEIADEKGSLAIARAIWANNPDQHEALRAAFAEAAPLATMDEIVRTPAEA
jgi:hypothetical protein